MTKVKLERDSRLGICGFDSQIVSSQDEIKIKDENRKVDVFHHLMSDDDDVRKDCRIKSETNSNMSDLGVESQCPSAKFKFKFEDDDSEDDPYPRFSSYTTSAKECAGGITKPPTVHQESSATIISPLLTPSPKPRKPRTVLTEKEVRAKLRDVDQKRCQERKQRIANDKKIKLLNTSLAEKNRSLEEADLALRKAVQERDQALEQVKQHTLGKDTQGSTELANLLGQNAILTQQVRLLQSAYDDAEKATIRLKELEVEVGMRDQRIKALTEENNLLRPEAEKLKILQAAKSKFIDATAGL